MYHRQLAAIRIYMQILHAREHLGRNPKMTHREIKLGREIIQLRLI